MPVDEPQKSNPKTESRAGADRATIVGSGTPISVTSGSSGRTMGTAGSESPISFAPSSQTNSPLTGSEEVTTELGQSNQYPQSKVEKRVIGYISKQD